jgi:hypothetical protein
MRGSGVRILFAAPLLRIKTTSYDLLDLISPIPVVPVCALISGSAVQKWAQRHSALLHLSATLPVMLPEPLNSTVLHVADGLDVFWSGAGSLLSWLWRHPMQGRLLHPSLTIVPEAIRELRKSFQGGLRYGHDSYRL